MVVPIAANFKRYCCKMSDNDDLLNYELGEDIEDPALLAGCEDEDELLLSDEEHEEQKALLKDEAEKWVNSALTIVKPQKSIGDDDDATTCKKVEDVVTTSSSLTACDNQLATENLDKVAGSITATESDVSTSEELPIKQIVLDKSHIEDELSVLSTKNDEVTSTNKEIEEQAVSQTPVEEKAEDDGKDEELGSQEFVYGMEQDQDDGPLSDPREDLDEERGERTNIKLSAERDDQMETSPERYQSGRYPSKRGRGGMAMRGGPHFPGYRPPVRYPHINYPQYPHYPNENINPQMVRAGSAGGFSGQYPPHPYGPMDPLMALRQPAPFPNSLPPRMDYHHRPLGPNFRPQNPNEFNVYRGPRPDYNMNGGQYNNFGPMMMRPMYRPNDGSNMPPMPPHMRPRMPMQRPPNMPPGQGNFMPQQHSSMPPGGPQHPGSMNPIGPGGSSSGGSGTAAAAAHSSSSHPGQSSGQQPVLPRKVLINPNFKGGVEAATNQLMKDTQFIQAISSHVSHLQSDEELLRQQEEFITQNRMHIQKRRYERSPERKRSRERSYSPSPLRRAIERRSPSRERRGRNRRGGAPELQPLSISRFRKEKEKIEEEEDEETRAYRMKIEKQKAMREKILRDKEMRRRKAAEGKLNEDKPQPAPEEPPSKLTPIIVTESKIISLKKRNAAAEQQQKQQQQLQHQSASLKSKPIQRTIPTAKILPESVKKIIDHTDKASYPGTASSGSNVTAYPIKKPIQIEQPQQIKNKSIIADDEFMLEEELLADTPSPPPSPLETLMIAEPDLIDHDECLSTRRPRRRVILKQPIEKVSMMWKPRHYQQSSSPPPASEKSSVPSEQMKKGYLANVYTVGRKN